MVAHRPWPISRNQLAAALDVETKSFSRAALTRIIRHAIVELANKKIQPLLIIDEASLLRLDVFAELHTLCQFDADSKPHLPVILAGQNNLIDLLQYRSSLPLASRIVAKSHLEGIDLEQMQFYLAHHLRITGVKVSSSLTRSSPPSSKARAVSYEKPTIWPAAH